MTKVAIYYSNSNAEAYLKLKKMLNYHPDEIREINEEKFAQIESEGAPKENIPSLVSDVDVFIYLGNEKEIRNRFVGKLLDYVSELELPVVITNPESREENSSVMHPYLQDRPVTPFDTKHIRLSIWNSIKEKMS